MRIDLKQVKARDIFPLMGVFDGVAVSVRGAFTVGWELELPVAYTVDEDGYDEMEEAFISALRVLPPWTVVHRQDLYTYSGYAAEREPGTWLEERYGRHFEGRRHLVHRAYLFVSYCGGRLVSKPGSSSGLFGMESGMAVPTKAQFAQFASKSGEFIKVLLTGGHISARRLEAADWLGDGRSDPGIVQRYMMLGSDGPVVSDIPMTPSTVRVHGKTAQAFTVSESRHLPPTVASVRKDDTMSTGPCEVFLSLGADIGVLLDCEHAVNHYIVVPPQQETLQKLDSKRKSMNAGISSRDNRVNHREISAFLEDAEQQNYLTVLTHLDVIAWGPDEEFDAITGKVGAAVMSMGMARAVRDLHGTPVLWYAGIPGAACDIGEENLMTQEVHAALCLGTWETFDRGLEKGGLRLCDRMRNVPLVLDVDEVSASLGWNNTYNKFVVGPSGTGKSFFMNRLLNCEYASGASVFIMDVGDSYEGQTSVVNETSGGRDGHYLSWDADHLPSFNPFTGFTGWLDANGNLSAFAAGEGAEETGTDFILSVLETLYTPDGGWGPANESVLKQMVRDFVEAMLEAGRTEADPPVFDDFYTFLSKTVAPKVRKGAFMVGDDAIGQDDFDIKQFHIALKPYSAKGEFHFLYNDPHPQDLFFSRWVVCELDRITHIKDGNFYSLVVLTLMYAFDMKMRRTQGRKVLVVDEAWQAIMNRTMAPYLKGLWKTCRKYSTAAVVVTQEIRDITSSDVIQDAILANSDIKILLNQGTNRNILLDTELKDEKKDIRKLLGLSGRDVALLLSMDRRNNPAYRYREVFIKWSGGRSAVYATEVSPEEALAYESNKQKKRPLMDLAAELGSVTQAIVRLADTNDKRSRQ